MSDAKRLSVDPRATLGTRSSTIRLRPGGSTAPLSPACSSRCGGEIAAPEPHATPEGRRPLAPIPEWPGGAALCVPAAPAAGRCPLAPQRPSGGAEQCVSSGGVEHEVEPAAIRDAAH
eukprot:9412088-Pyramimonas_sp.AAC.1